MMMMMMMMMMSVAVYMCETYIRGRMGERNTTNYTSSKLLGKEGNIHTHTHTPIFSDLCVFLGGGMCVI